MRSSPGQYDSTIYGMRDVLRSFSLVGYHCTKLTREEIESVRLNGLRLQSSVSLADRIDQLVVSGSLDPEVAFRLKAKNQADDPNRARMLWFCFFEPCLAGQSGIQRFFRCWGGEALYNSHESCHGTGDVLRSIGVPCVVVATVPIASLTDSFYPDTSMVRAYLSKRGHKITNPIEHEGFSTEDIAAHNIRDVVEYPSNEFLRLTGCEAWDPPIAEL